MTPGSGMMMSELGIGISGGSEEVGPHQSSEGAAARYHHELYIIRVKCLSADTTILFASYVVCGSTLVRHAE